MHTSTGLVRFRSSPLRRSGAAASTPRRRQLLKRPHRASSVPAAKSSSLLALLLPRHALLSTPCNILPLSQWQSKSSKAVRLRPAQGELSASTGRFFLAGACPRHQEAAISSALQGQVSFLDPRAQRSPNSVLAARSFTAASRSVPSTSSLARTGDLQRRVAHEDGPGQKHGPRCRFSSVSLCCCEESLP